MDFTEIWSLGRLNNKGFNYFSKYLFFNYLVVCVSTEARFKARVTWFNLTFILARVETIDNHEFAWYTEEDILK